jgi:deoxyribodipyrimidine photo-lyase
MRRARRAPDDPALDVVIEVANELRVPLAVFFGIVLFYPNANERPFAFRIDGLPGIAEGIERRGAGDEERAPGD